MEPTAQEVGDMVAALKRLGRASRDAVAALSEREQCGDRVGAVEAGEPGWVASLHDLVAIARDEYPNTRITISVIAHSSLSGAERIQACPQSSRSTTPTREPQSANRSST